MTLKKSDTTKKCPNCGAPLKRSSTPAWLTIIAIIFITGMTGYWFANDKSKKTSKIHITPPDIAEEQIKRVETGQEIITESFEEIKKQRRSFNNSIEEHYQRLVSLYKNNEYEAAADELELFETFDTIGYKDVATIYHNVRISVLEKKVTALPSTRLRETLDIYRELRLLDPANAEYNAKVSYYERLLNAKEKAKAEKQCKASCELELISWQLNTKYDYAIAQGQVKNISGSILKDVEAIVTWYDSNKNMITSDKALIDYISLVPNQISPFMLMERYTPAMKGATIEFKQLTGGELRTYRKVKGPIVHY